MEHEYIYRNIENKILNEEFQPHDKVLSENQACTKFNVSRTLIRDVYKELIIDGYIYSVHGKGYFVNDKKYWMKNISLNKKFPSSEYNNQILEHKINLSQWFVENYDLTPDDFECFTKARYLDKHISNITYVFLNKTLVLNFDLPKIERSVIKFLREDFNFKKSYNFIRIEKADEFDAKTLKIPKGEFLICEYSIINNTDEQIIQCSLDKKRIEDFSFGYIANVV